MDFHFASPWYLLLLVAVAGWGGKSLAPKALSSSLRYGHFQLIQPEALSWRVRLRQLLPIWRQLILAFLIIALARPQVRQKLYAVEAEKVDIVLALDISNSMAALDFAPHNRLEAAKAMIEKLVAERPYDRIGLVVFSGQAFSQSPPTRDHKSIGRLLDELQLSSDMGLEDGTALGQGLAEAAALLRNSAADKQIIIFLTDGVDTVGIPDPLTIALAAAALNIHVYTIGMGRPGPVPFPQQGLEGAYTVNWESPLDEATLQQIATMTKGIYYRPEDSQALDQIYLDIQNLEPTNQAIALPIGEQELFSWFVCVALALFLIEICLRQTVLRQVP